MLTERKPAGPEEDKRAGHPYPPYLDYRMHCHQNLVLKSLVEDATLDNDAPNGDGSLPSPSFSMMEFTEIPLKWGNGETQRAANLLIASTTVFTLAALRSKHFLFLSPYRPNCRQKRQLPHGLVSDGAHTHTQNSNNAGADMSRGPPRRNKLKIDFQLAGAKLQLRRRWLIDSSFVRHMGQAFTAITCWHLKLSLVKILP